MNEIILITGATGNTGAPLVNLLAAKGAKVRAAVHSKAKAQFPANVEVVEMHLENSASVEAAFQGAAKAYFVSPFVDNMVALAKPVVAAAKKAGVKHLVRLSAAGAEAPNPITIGRWQREIEVMVEQAGIPFTHLRPNFFMQNFSQNHAASIKQQGAFYTPQGEGKSSYIDVRDISAVAAAVLTSSGHEGKAYALTGGESLSNLEAAAIFSKVLGKPVAYVDVPEAAARQGMQQFQLPAWMIDVIMELNAIAKAGYTASISPVVEQITGKKPISFEQFVKDNLAAFK